VRAFRASLQPILHTPDAASSALLHTRARAHPRMLGVTRSRAAYARPHRSPAIPRCFPDL